MATQSVEVLTSRHIVVYSTGFIGDILISLRFIAALKNSEINCKISLVTTPLLEEVAISCKAIDNVLVYDKRGEHKGKEGIGYIVERINALKPDIYINLHPGYRASKIARAINGDVRKYRYSNSQGKWLYNGINVPYIKGIHELSRLQEFYKLICPSSTEYNTTVDIVFSEAIEDDVNSKVGQFLEENKELVLIFPGTVWPTKQWPIEKFTELAASLTQNHQVIICGSGNEKMLGASIQRQCPNSIDMTGKLSLIQSLYLVSIASRVYCNDSAPTHMANLVGTPVTSIFGPTSPIFGFYPTESNDTVVYKDLECSPCSIHGTKECPLGHHNCMNSITIDEVLGS